MNTDDLRESPNVELAERLHRQGLRGPHLRPDRQPGAPDRRQPRATSRAGCRTCSRLLVGTADEALAGRGGGGRRRPPDPTRTGRADRGQPATSCIDLHGRLGDEVESLPGYEGVGWVVLTADEPTAPSPDHRPEPPGPLRPAGVAGVPGPAGAGYDVTVVCPKGEGDPAYAGPRRRRRSTSTARTPPAAARSASSSSTPTRSWRRRGWCSGPARRAGSTSCRPATRPTSSGRSPGCCGRCDRHPVRLRPPRPVPRALRLPVRRRPAGCPAAGCSLLERATFRTADRVTSTNESYAEIADPPRWQGPVATSRSCAPGRTRTRLRRGEPVPALRRGRPLPRGLPRRDGPAGRRRPRGPGGRVRRARARPRRHRLHLHGRRGDCYDDLVALRDELRAQPTTVDLPGRVPDETVLDVLSTADVGLCPDPLNPLNDVSTMNKTMEYMAFGLPVVAFDLQGDPGVGRRCRGLRRPRRRRGVRPGDRRPPGRRGPAGRDGPPTVAQRIDERARLGAPAGGVRRRSTTPWSADRRAPPGSRGLSMCGVAGAFQQADGKVLVADHGRAHRAPRSGCGRGRRPGSAVAAPLGHRRLSIIDLSEASRPAVRLTTGCTCPTTVSSTTTASSRAELQGSGCASAPSPTPRWCWRRGAPGAPMRCRGSGGCSPSRSSTSGPATLTLVRDPLGIKPLYVHAARRRRRLRLRAQGDGRGGRAGADRRPGRPGRLDALLLAARGALRHPGGAQASRRHLGRVPDRTAAPGPAATGSPRRRPRRRPRARPPTSAASLEDSVAAHLVADVAGRLVPQRRPGLEPGHRDGAPARPGRSRRTRSPSAPRTSGWRRCPTTRVYARKMAAHLGIRLHEIEISPDVVDLLPRIVDMLDEPIGDPAAINTLLMCEAARASRGQGPAVRDGRRRAVRRLPQAPGLPARRRATSGCPPRFGPRSIGPAVRRLPVAVGGRGLRYRPLGASGS